MKEKNVLVTGGTSGLGGALVDVFLQNGWKVSTCGRRRSIIDEMKNAYGERICAMVCDLRVDSFVSAFLNEVQEKMGGLDVLILNAGTIGQVPLPTVEEMDLKGLRMMFETNFFGNVSFLKKSLPLLRNGGLVVHITSDSAIRPYKRWGAYASAKAAMDILIKILDLELEDRNIRALSIDPGDMNTEMHRLAIPDDTSPLKNPMDSAQEVFRKISSLMGEE